MCCGSLRYLTDRAFCSNECSHLPEVARRYLEHAIAPQTQYRHLRFDCRLLDGAGAMQWKLLGIFPVMVASGSDITQSAVGRLQAESVWLPSVFCSDDVSWTKMDSSHLHSSFVVQGERGDLISPLITLLLSNWGTANAGTLIRWEFGQFGYVCEFLSETHCSNP